MSKAIVSAKRLAKTYRMGNVDVRALREATFEVEEGSFAAIVGPSGSGKSTLLNLLGLIDRPSEGELYLDGRAAHRMSERERTRRRAKDIGFVFQSFHLVPVMNVLENVMIQLYFCGVPASEREKRAVRALTDVGLDHRLRHFPRDLSGGERQRVSIARAIAKDPRIILADEPTGSLDSRSGEEILRLLESFRRAGKTVLMVTHDLGIAVRADRQFVMRDGVLREIREKDAHGLLEALAAADDLKTDASSP